MSTAKDLLPTPAVACTPLLFVPDVWAVLGISLAYLLFTKLNVTFSFISNNNYH